MAMAPKPRKSSSDAVVAATNPGSANASTSKKRKRNKKSNGTPLKDDEKGTPGKTLPTVENNSATKKRKRKIKPSVSVTDARAKSEKSTVKSPRSKSKRNEKKVQKPVDKTPSTKNEKPTGSEKKEFPPTLDARVHRLRHMEYIPGSLSAFTPKSTEDGQVVVARSDGSYELKAVSPPPSRTSSSIHSDQNSTFAHRLITIAETPSLTGATASSSREEEEEDDENSLMEDVGSDDRTEVFPDAATSLCWVYASGKPVCVGSGPNGNLWIVDFKNSGPTHVTSSGGGGIFDLGTCCKDSKTTDPLPFVATACEDGSVRIWQIGSDGDEPSKIHDTPLATLPSSGAPVLSLVWKNFTTSIQGTTTLFQTVIFAAVADGTIRKYGLDIQQQCSNSGGVTEHFYSVPNPPKAILRMTIENKGRKDPTKVWTLLLLRDNTLVAGNSLGQVQFWNGETGTLTQTVIQSNSQADVLKMVANSDETKIFCSGVDSRVVCLERKQPPIIATSTHQSNAAALANPNDLTALVTSHVSSYRPWKMSVSQRAHTHDVKAMAMVKTLSKETLLTGGVDTKICSYSVSTFAQTRPQTWYPWPSATSLFSSTSSVPSGHSKLVAMQRHDRVELYELEALKTYKGKLDQGRKSVSAHESLKATLAQHQSSFPIGTIRLTGQNGVASSSPLRASMLSPDGKYLAVSNMSSTYVFELNFVPDTSNMETSTRLQPRKLELPGKLQGVSATSFCFEGSLLCVGDSSGSGQVHVLSLCSKTNRDDEDVTKTVKNGAIVNHDKISISQTLSLPVSKNAEQVLLPIQSIHAQGDYIVAVSHSNENAIHVFKQFGKTRQYRHYWTLPSLGKENYARAAAVALLRGNRLAVATYRSHLFIFDMRTKALNEWSQKNGFPINDKRWTEDSLCGRGYPLRLIPHGNERLVMTSFGTFCVIDLSKPIPRHCRTVPKRRVWKNRRKYEIVVHNDDQDANDDEDENDDHWLEPRVTKEVEDEYLQNDPDGDGDDDDNTELKQSLASSLSPTKLKKKLNDPVDEELASRSCTICSHYRNMLYIDFLGPKEMLVVEQPWLEVAQTLPAALQRRIYGAD